MEPEVEGTPAEAVRFATYVGDDEDVIAAYRAARILGSRWYDTWPTWLAIVVVGHGLVLLGVVIAASWALGLPGGDGELIPFPAVLLNVGLGLAGAWVLYARVYGYRRNLTRRILDRPAVPAPATYEFTTRDIASRTVLGEIRYAWEQFREVAEFRDGFVLVHVENLWEWIPKRAFRAPFDPAAAAAYFRERAPKFVAIDRAAGLPGGPAREEAAIGPIEPAAPPEALGSAAFVYDEPTCREAWAARREIVEAPRDRKTSLALVALVLAGFFGASWAQRPVPLDDPGAYWGSRCVAAGLVALVVGFIGRPSGGATAWDKWRDAFPLRGEEVRYEFHPRHLARSSATGCINVPWGLVRRAVETADGFYLVTFTGDEWIPKRSLEAPFRPGDLATLLRGKVRSYRVDASRATRSRDRSA